MIIEEDVHLETSLNKLKLSYKLQLAKDRIQAATSKSEVFDVINELTTDLEAISTQLSKEKYGLAK